MGDSLFFKEFQDRRAEAALQGVFLYSHKAAGASRLSQDQFPVKGFDEAGIDDGGGDTPLLQ